VQLDVFDEALAFIGYTLEQSRQFEPGLLQHNNSGMQTHG
jgi:hypothetical protein